LIDHHRIRRRWQRIHETAIGASSE
jgi:hypothetical protein